MIPPAVYSAIRRRAEAWILIRGTIMGRLRRLESLFRGRHSFNQIAGR